MGSTRGRTRTLEAARRVAFIWNTVGDPGQQMLREKISPALARELDTLLEAARAPEPAERHAATSWKSVSRGRAENGWQPETEYLWTCSCREGHSGDMNDTVWAKQAVDKHLEDPTQFPGWLT